jgi:hypothetical protein
MTGKESRIQTSSAAMAQAKVTLDPLLQRTRRKRRAV